MCLLFNKHTPVRIATKDIVVYKILNKWGDKTLHSPFWGIAKKWIIGRKYRVSKLGIIPSMCSSFDEQDETNAIKKWGRKNIWSVAEGFHSSKTKERIQDNHYEIYECIIPKGAKYITGIDGLMVSNQLKVIKAAK